MAYTDIDDPSAYFQTTLYTGNGGTLAVTNGGNSDLQPDWLWLKKRNADVNHFLFDSVRGASKELNSNNTEAEASPSNYLSSFNSDGFSIGSDSDINGNNDTLVAWQWKAGTSFTNDASSTSVGSIDSAGSVNTDAGFSIVSFTGGGANATIKHGLTSKPSMIIVKARGRTSTWSVYHTSLGATKFLRLEGTNAVGTEAGWWNNTEPTSSVFSIGTNHYANTQIAYCFSEKQGFSKFGSYIGNGQADGTYVHLGFSPAWIMRKKTSGTENWTIHDNKRDTHNVTFKRLLANDSGAEYDSASNQVDLLSNGFKCRASNDGSNASGGNYIFMAFAENPFVTSTGVPATAR